MNVLWNGFAAKLHSWSIVGQNICKQFIKDNHDVDIFSTNGNSLLPDYLKNNLKCYIEEGVSYTEKQYKEITSNLKKEYDIQLSYTAMRNFPYYFNRGNSNRFGIWCYEFAGKNALPTGFAKNHIYVDKILAPSLNAKEIFIDSGIPDNKIEIVPHGYDESFVNRNDKLFISNKFVFGANIAQPHMRKNINGLLESWGKAFTKNDDVVLAIKISSKTKGQPFEINFYEVLKSFKFNYPNHAEIIVIDKFIENISDFYRGCDSIFSLSNAESFLIPALEALAAKKVLICSNYGGQLDFCSDKNSILVNGTMMRANPKMLYWENKSNTFVFNPDTNDAAEKLKHVYNNYSSIKESIDFDTIIKNYTWENVYNKIIRLVK